MSEATKPCPICGEEIKSVATKCIHCGEFIDARIGCSGWLRASWAEITGDKTLWDFVSLLIVPIALAGLAFMLSRFETDRQNRDRNAQATVEAEAEKDRSEEVALQTYLDRMSELLLEKDLRKPVEGAEARGIARARTLTVLRQLDAYRKSLLLRFLYESELITGGEQNAAIVDLRDADLTEADLRNAFLPGVNLHRAHLNEAVLFRANLRDANLSRADLSRADLRGANLRDAVLWWAVLREADLRRADMRRADMRRAILTEADLRGADLRRADLSRAILMEADLSRAILSEADLSRAQYTDNTQWPDGFDPVAAGAELVSD